MKSLKERIPFYEQTWFIMLLLFTPLFFVGLYLLWRSQAHRVMKIGFTVIYVYAIYYTISTQGLPIS